LRFFGVEESIKVDLAEFEPYVLDNHDTNIPIGDSICRKVKCPVIVVFFLPRIFRTAIGDGTIS